MKAVLRPALILIVLAAGCSGYTPGGNGWSDDTYCYPSTAHLPQTIALKDTRTGQTVWAMDIPVGQQCIVRFSNKGGDSDARGFDEMKWRLMPLGGHGHTLENSITCPPRYARLVAVSFREGPEYMPTTEPIAAKPAPMPSGVTIADAPKPKAVEKPAEKPSEKPAEKPAAKPKDGQPPVKLPD